MCNLLWITLESTDSHSVQISPKLFFHIVSINNDDILREKSTIIRLKLLAPTSSSKNKVNHFPLLLISNIYLELNNIQGLHKLVEHNKTIRKTIRRITLQEKKLDIANNSSFPIWFMRAQLVVVEQSSVVPYNAWIYLKQCRKDNYLLKAGFTCNFGMSH